MYSCFIQFACFCWQHIPTRISAALHEKNSLLEECWRYSLGEHPSKQLQNCFYLCALIRRKNEETKTKFQQQLSKEQQKFTHEVWLTIGRFLEHWGNWHHAFYIIQLEAAKQQTQSAEEKLENVVLPCFALVSNRVLNWILLWVGRNNNPTKRTATEKSKCFHQ